MCLGPTFRRTLGWPILKRYAINNGECHRKGAKKHAESFRDCCPGAKCLGGGAASESTACTVWYKNREFAILALRQILALLRNKNKKGSRMENERIDELRSQLNQLLEKQAEILESRCLGSATDVELLEYEIRQEIVHELCNRLAHSAAV